MDPKIILDINKKLDEFEEALVGLVKKAQQFRISFQSRKLKRLHQDMTTWLSATSALFTYCEIILDRNIQWHPTNTDRIEMHFHHGSSPWSFWLTYDRSSDIQIILNEIESAWKHNELQKIEEPKVGDFVCCCDDTGVFRGYIISTLSKEHLKVLNIDEYQVYVVKMHLCYHLKAEYSELHSNIIRCCLTKDTFDETKWNYDVIESLFEPLLEENSLIVKIIEKVETVPPKFYIELSALNENKVEINVNHWLVARLLPALENLSKDAEPDIILPFLDADIINPFICISSTTNSPSDTESNIENNVEIPNLRKDPQLPALFDQKKTDVSFSISEARTSNEVSSDTTRTDILLRTLFKKQISLPEKGAETKIIVTNILNSTSFYGVIPSGLEDCGNKESIESLVNRLNNPDYVNSLKRLRVRPCFGRLIIAYCSSKKQWLRAAVRDFSYTKALHVIFVDSGISEVIDYEECREIPSEMIGLPFQAIYCSLFALNVNTTKADEGKSFLEYVILNNGIDVYVVNSYAEGGRLEVVAYTPSGCLNNLMVNVGFCSRVQPHF